MSSITKALERGYERYYNTLIKMGYINKRAVNSLIVAQWIYDVLEGKYDYFVTDEEYSLLSKLYMCVEGNCLVPYQNYCRDFTVNKLPDNRYTRITETGTLDIDDNDAGDRERVLENFNDLRMI